MALEEYRRKRDFGKTPEPPPGAVKARKEELSYLIQKHDATRLHYDFRLELDGVLLSWPSGEKAKARKAAKSAKSDVLARLKRKKPSALPPPQQLPRS